MRIARLAATLLALAGCGAPPPTHVVLVSIDSLRADHLGCYGYARPTSPRMDALAAEGTLVEHAISSTSWTLPAHAALFTGLADELHQVTDQGRALSPSLPTLAERLSQAGFATAAVVSGPYLHPRFGLARGFHDYLNCMSFLDEQFRPAGALDLHAASHRDRTGPCVVRRAGDWLRAHVDGPAFLFLHFWDVHYDYIPPAELVERFDPGYAGSVDASNYAHNPAIAADMNPRDLAHVVALYDAEIAYTDARLGEVLDLLDTLGLSQRSLVVVTADHGDAFFEHGEKGHQKDLHREVLRIPILLRGPGVPAGLRLPGPAQITDLAPTLLELLGLPPLEPPGPGSGQSLVPALHDPSALEGRQLHAMLRAAGHHAESLESLTRKVIRDRAAGRLTGYDLRSDPQEQRPLVFPLGDARRLDEATRALRQRAAAFPPPVQIPLPDAAVEARLRALGYTE